MKTIKKKTMHLFFLLFVTALTFAQNNLQDLVGDKATYLDQSMRDKGYKFISTSKGGDSSYQNWYSSSRNRCVTVRIYDGRVESIVNSTLADCGKSNYNNNYNNNNYNNSYNNNRYDNDYNSNRSDMVVVYRDANFRGQSSNLSMGYHDFDDLGVGNDRISSIRVPRGFSVTVYADANYRGRSRTYTNDVDNLEDFNDKVSSILINKNYGQQNRKKY